MENNTSTTGTASTGTDAFESTERGTGIIENGAENGPEITGITGVDEQPTARIAADPDAGGTGRTEADPVTDRVPVVEDSATPAPTPAASGPDAAGPGPFGDLGAGAPGPSAHAGTPAGGPSGAGPRPATPGIGDRVAAFRLRRSSTDRMLGGVCGGLAADLGVDPALLRIAVLVLTLFTGGAAALVYLAVWLIAPAA
ncbi:PspC domain-containing protein [Pseudonocardia sp. ICBG1142]|uniref:PspC domain-containing protein n=1 Tax=Pseudonocardia sp. ICBG1142 TaxID=2846760 RepID=UPI001CF6C13F|nr:PspC domain-containing protein [Pseudonocardia sp. ICBG1142]